MKKFIIITISLLTTAGIVWYIANSPFLTKILAASFVLIIYGVIAGVIGFAIGQGYEKAENKKVLAKALADQESVTPGEVYSSCISSLDHLDIHGQWSVLNLLTKRITERTTNSCQTSCQSTVQNSSYGKVQ